MAPGRKMFYFVFVYFFILAHLPSGCKAGLEYVQQFPAGELAICDPCRLGRGKCRKVCLEEERTAGYCKVNFLCCQRIIY
ncbi:beta-defensin 105A-like [Tenrec ecaudatus]|uniref:beta-defensin 105A-like n=1 Tax=Tenrec ecaudatus TaxID=94439 RepID=UPI003F59DA52